MSELLEFYQAQAESNLSTIPWLASLQQKALSELSRTGFPGRKDEEWKYTRIEPLLEQRFVTNEEQVSSQNQPCDLPLGHVIHINNGEISGLDAWVDALPKGALIVSLAEALKHHADKIKPYLSQTSAKNAFGALNTAMLDRGVFIYLPKGVHVEQTIAISHWQDKDKQAMYLRHVIVAEEGAEASIVEDYRGAKDCTYFTNTQTDVFTETNAKITHYKLQRESMSAFHIGHIAVQQQGQSQFNAHSFSFGGKLVRSDLHIQLLQPHAQCLMNGVYAPDQGQHIDHHTTVEHRVPDCQSQQDYKGILKGDSRAVFNGKVIVVKDAQHTEAQQQNKNILLSEKAEVDTKPQLEIFADDVTCSHGATVGQLDEDALFYLATRGLGREEATLYLIQAFAAENIALIPEPALAKWVGDLLNEQLR